MKALLVIDMLVDFIDPAGALYIGPEAQKLIAAVRSRLEHYRSENAPVIYLCDNHVKEDLEFEMFPPHGLAGSGGEVIIPGLAPQSGDRVIHKRRFSAFFGTDLDLTLREMGVTGIELAGVCTNICILYTSADARMLNYQVAVKPEAVASFDREAHRFALRELENTLGVELI